MIARPAFAITRAQNAFTLNTSPQT